MAARGNKQAASAFAFGALNVGSSTLGGVSKSLGARLGRREQHNAH